MTRPGGRKGNAGRSPGRAKRPRSSGGGSSGGGKGWGCPLSVAGPLGAVAAIAYLIHQLT